MTIGNAESLSYILPEIILSIGILVTFALDTFSADKRVIGLAALASVAISLFALAAGGGEPAWLFSRMMVHDPFGAFFKTVFALSALAGIWMSLDSREVARTNQGEYYGLMLSSTLGMYFMATANNLLMAYLSLEFVSITSYVLTGFMRHDRRSGEAALKYLIYGGVASGTMIYGMSWIFGLAGTMDFIEISKALASNDPNKLAAFIGILLTLSGFGYKIAAVPFHMWSPDVYTGAPIPVATFLSVGSKAAGFALAIRFFYPGLSQHGADGTWTALAGIDWPNLVMALSMVTMSLGNLTALNQTNMKRMLAYSSIAHAGYLMMGLVVLTDEALKAVMFYIVTYYLMNVGAFLVVMIVANSTGREDMAALRGLAWRGGAAPAAAMAVFMFSLIGLPPFAGFVGKFTLFAAVVNKGLYFLALVGLLNSVVSLGYYVRVVRTMFLDEPDGTEGEITVAGTDNALLWALCTGTIVLGVYWDPVFRWADRSMQFFLG